MDPRQSIDDILDEQPASVGEYLRNMKAKLKIQSGLLTFPRFLSRLCPQISSPIVSSSSSSGSVPEMQILQGEQLPASLLLASPGAPPVSRREPPESRRPGAGAPAPLHLASAALGRQVAEASSAGRVRGRRHPGDADVRLATADSAAASLRGDRLQSGFGSQHQSSVGSDDRAVVRKRCLDCFVTGYAQSVLSFVVSPFFHLF